MVTSCSLKPGLLLALSPSFDRVRTQNSLFYRTHFGGFSGAKPFLRGSVCVARFGFRPGLLPDPDGSEGTIRELLSRAESLFYTIADAAVSSSETMTSTAKQQGDWLSGITNYMETVLKVLKGGLSAVHVPYAYGFAIILLTILVKAATFPLTKKQVESAMAMRSLQPQIKAIQERYAGDQERIQLETARLYKLAGINPLAGCLPTLATIPVWIGLYRALSNVADEGLLTEGFFWIPSLAGPTTIAARQNGSGISWLFPFVDGHPPLGWSDTVAYLVLPVLLVVSQYISVQIMQSAQSNDPNMKSSQAVTKFLPLMIGYFALSVPSGLSLYWFTNNILSTAQQVWLQKLGGAKNLARDLNDDITKERPQIPKPLPEMTSTKTGAKQVDKLTPEGLRPGDRFKQIKEQEARRRQQREEERGKAEEAAANANQVVNRGHETEGNLLGGENGKENGFGAGSGDGNNISIKSQNSSNVGIVNGDISSKELKDGQELISSISKDNSELSEHTDKDAVEAFAGAATTDNQHSGEETHRATED